VKKAAVIVALLAASPFFLFYFGMATSLTAAWMFAWIVLFAWFTFSKADFATRGLVLIGGSILFAVIGRMLLVRRENEQVLEALSQAFLIVGGGVGGNFLAYSMLPKREAKRPDG
jgi:hypothetical protein